MNNRNDGAHKSCNKTTMPPRNSVRTTLKLSQCTYPLTHHINRHSLPRNTQDKTHQHWNLQPSPHLSGASTADVHCQSHPFMA